MVSEVLLDLESEEPGLNPESITYLLGDLVYNLPQF